MNLLLDHNLDGRLAQHLAPHAVHTVKALGWQRYANGKLLAAAQSSFHVLLTTDSNLYHQQKVEQYDLAVIVLRVYSNSFAGTAPLMTEVLELLPDIEMGQVRFLYIDDRLRQSDQRRRRGLYARKQS